MIPYPWPREHTFDPARRWSSRVTTVVGVPAAIVAVFLGGPIPIVVGIAIALRWRYTNASPRSYGLIMLGAGLVLAAATTLFYGGMGTILIGLVVPAAIVGIIWWSPTVDSRRASLAYLIAAQTFLITALWAATGGFTGIDTHVLSFTAPAANGPLPLSDLPYLWLVWFPYSLIIGSFTLYWWCTSRDYSTQRYLEPRRETWIAKRRKERTIAAYTDTQPDDAFVPGMVVGDRLPWRQDRNGVPIIIPTNDEIGHGMVTGANGSGKTVFGLTLSEQSINKAIPVIFTDFKGDIANRNKLDQMSEDTGAEFYSFDLRLADSDASNCYFDPLAFEEDRNTKAAVVSQSFQYETTSEEYYRTATDEWLPLQLAVMEIVGLDDGQGTFDFLAATASVPAIKSLIEPLQHSDSGLYTELSRQIDAMDDKRLEGLRTNLRRIVNSPAGARMHRPTVNEIEAGARYLDLSKLADNPSGSVVYFGLGIGGQGGLAKMLGALVVYSIVALIQSRNSNPSHPRPDYLLIADEFGLLEEYTDMFKILFFAARSARVWVWVMAQSFTTFTEQIVDAIVANVYWFASFKVADKATAERLAGTTAMISYRSEVTEGIVNETATGGRKMSRTGGVRTDIKPDFHIPPDLFTKLKPRHAYVWCNQASEPSARDQWWRRGRVTFREERDGPDAVPKDIPMMVCLPSDIVIQQPDETVPAQAAPAPVSVAQPITQQQRGTLEMLRRWVGEQTFSSFLSEEKVTSFAALDRAAASRMIGRALGLHMRELHAAVGDNRYYAEYNKVARFHHKPTLTSTDDIADSYNRLPIAAVRTLHDQLHNDLTAQPTVAPETAAVTTFDDDEAFEWGVLDAPDDTVPPPEEPPLDDAYQTDPNDNSSTENSEPSNPAPPVSPDPVTPTIIDRFTDDDDHDSGIDALISANRASAAHPVTADETSDHQDLTWTADDTDGTGDTEDDLTDDSDDAQLTTVASHAEAPVEEAEDAPSKHEQWWLNVCTRAYDLINLDPEEYGLQILDPPYEYVASKGDNEYGVLITKAVFDQAVQHARVQIPPLD